MNGLWGVYVFLSKEGLLGVEGRNEGQEVVLPRHLRCRRAGVMHPSSRSSKGMNRRPTRSSLD